MLAKELPESLQSLLIVVERIINRIPLEDLPIGYCNEDRTNHDHCYTSGATLPLANAKEPPTKSNCASSKYSIDSTLSPKCGLRRQELITKNKQINTKYTLRRMSGANGDETETSTLVADIDVGSNEVSAVDLGDNREIMQMPLFCLGGSFPHIDSDEESDDDIIKANAGKCIFFQHYYLRAKLSANKEVFFSRADRQN